MNLTLKRTDTAEHSDITHDIAKFENTNEGRYRCMVSCSHVILLPSTPVLDINRICELSLIVALVNFLAMRVVILLVKF